MRIRCIAELPNEEQARKLGRFYERERQVFSVDLGKVYLVYGMSFLGAAPWVEIADEYEQISAAPLCLFEVVDPQVPSVWQVRIHDNGSVSLWPAPFYGEGFFEDLLERVPEAVASFRLIRRQLEAEEVLR